MDLYSIVHSDWQERDSASYVDNYNDCIYAYNHYNYPNYNNDCIYTYHNNNNYVNDCVNECSNKCANGGDNLVSSYHWCDFELDSGYICNKCRLLSRCKII